MPFLAAIGGAIAGAVAGTAGAAGTAAGATAAGTLAGTSAGAAAAGTGAGVGALAGSGSALGAGVGSIGGGMGTLGAGIGSGGGALASSAAGGAAGGVGGAGGTAAGVGAQLAGLAGGAGGGGGASGGIFGGVMGSTGSALGDQLVEQVVKTGVKQGISRGVDAATAPAPPGSPYGDAYVPEVPSEDDRRVPDSLNPLLAASGGPTLSDVPETGSIADLYGGNGADLPYGMGPGLSDDSFAPDYGVSPDEAGAMADGGGFFSAPDPSSPTGWTTTRPAAPGPGWGQLGLGLAGTAGEHLGNMRPQPLAQPIGTELWGTPMPEQLVPGVGAFNDPREPYTVPEHLRGNFWARPIWSPR